MIRTIFEIIYRPVLSGNWIANIGMFIGTVAVSNVLLKGFKEDFKREKK